MSVTWRSDEPPPPLAPVSVAGWLRAVLRGAVLCALLAAGMLALAVLRPVERPFAGLRRPVSGQVNRIVSRAALAVIGLRLVVRGLPLAGRGALVANHSSWLDILALNAAARVFFVAKSEVAGWPGIGWLARASGTLFITRAGREARRQALLFEARLRAGQRLLFFPEGTSSDGLRVLPFKTTLFAAFFAQDLPGLLSIQPVSLRYAAPQGQDARFYGWWGDMALGGHLLRMLAAPRHGHVEVVFCPSLRVSDFTDRKALAAVAEAAVRAALPDQPRSAAM
jgi:1-acyl-sn-glycerol-3-phosphate acyltransferase